MGAGRDEIRVLGRLGTGFRVGESAPSFVKIN